MTTFSRAFLVAALACAALPVCAAEPKVETEDQKAVYAIGLAIAESLQRFHLSAEELEVFKAGLTDGALKRPTKVDLKTYQAKIQEFGQKRAAAAAEAEKKESEVFLKKMEGEKGAVKTESGLIYLSLKEGDGESPTATDTVKVHYQGTLRDGTVFDSSIERGTPATFPLNRVIPCWTEGVQRMKVGGKAKLVCPSNIAYGDRGSPPKISGGAALLFEVELLGIEKVTPGAARPMEKPPGHP